MKLIKEYIVTFTATVQAETEEQAEVLAFEKVEMDDCSTDIEEV